MGFVLSERIRNRCNRLLAENCGETYLRWPTFLKIEYGRPKKPNFSEPKNNAMATDESNFDYPVPASGCLTVYLPQYDFLHSCTAQTDKTAKFIFHLTANVHSGADVEVPSGRGRLAREQSYTFQV